jgi:hypothetical protein
VIDAELLQISYYPQPDFMWVSILVQSEAIIFCNFSYFEIITSSDDNKTVSCRDGRTIIYKNLGSLFSNENSRGELYATMVSPPGVLQIRADDIWNVYIEMVYQVAEEAFYTRLIGLPVLAFNNNYILHLMMDTLTGDQTLRVYNKKSNYFSTALFDYKLERESKTNFMTFPSQFLDIVIIRDELTVKLIQMSENRLVINATNRTRVEELLNNG